MEKISQMIAVDLKAVFNLSCINQCLDNEANIDMTRISRQVGFTLDSNLLTYSLTHSMLQDIV